MSAYRFSRFLLVFAMVLGLPLAPATADQATSKPSTAPEHVAGRALVGAHPAGRSQARSAIEGRGGKVLSHYAPGNFFVVQTPSAAPEWVSSMNNNPSVRYAELDYVVGVDATPDDPYFVNGSMWGLNDPQDNDIDAPEAWDVGTSAANVVVGVIDTGVDYTHVDLNDNMWTNLGETAGDGLDNDANGWVDDVYGADCRNNDGNPMDDHYHGTHVAGTVGAEGNNTTGVVGVAWDVQIMALKFLSSSGSGAISDAVECLDYATMMNAHLTSNSWGGGGYSQAMRDAIERARKGHTFGNGKVGAGNQLFIAAAGNDSKNSDVSPYFPSGYDNDNVVAVASTTSTDAMSSFSNYGASTVDLGAPGSLIWSTMPNNAYDDLSGTSMATPHVAGAAALIMGKHGTAMAYDRLLDRLYGSVDPLASLAGKTVTGGRLNVARAIETETNPHGTPVVSVAASTRTSVSLAWTIAATDADPIRYQLDYSTDGGSSWTRAEPPGASATTATVAGLLPSTSYTFRLIARDNVGNASQSTATGSTASGDVVFSDMEADSSKWTAGSPWKPSAQRPHSGSNAWTDSENNVYANSKDISIKTSSSFSLPSSSSPSLTFWHRHNLEPGYDYAYAYISIDGGSSWTQLARYNGHLDHYKAETIDLSPYAGQSNVRLRFRLYTDRSVTYDGWYVDDVIVSVASSAPDTDAPSGSITSPAPGSPVSGTVTVASADAADNSGGSGLAEVEFFVDATSIGKDSNGTDGWSVSWNTTSVTNGEHTLTAKITDVAGNSSTSPGSAVTVDNSATPALAVTVTEGTHIKRGPWYHQDVAVSVSVAGATVDFKVYSGACSTTGSQVHSEVVTLSGTGHTFTFKTRTTGSYCAIALATKSGYTDGTGMADITV